MSADLARRHGINPPTALTNRTPTMTNNDDTNEDRVCAAAGPPVLGSMRYWCTLPEQHADELHEAWVNGTLADMWRPDTTHDSDHARGASA